MYSIDGIPLDNPAVKWSLMAATKPRADLNAQRTSLRIPGRPGVADLAETTFETLDAPTLTFVVETRAPNYEALLSLFATGTTLTLTDIPGRSATYGLLSTGYEAYGDTDQDERIDVTALVRIPGVFWRDTAVSTFMAALGAANVTLDAWACGGMVVDPIVRVTGPVTGCKITSGPAWLTFPDLTAGQWLRYDSATGRAYLTTTDTWSGGTEVSGQVGVDGPANCFAVFPTRLSPTVSVGRVGIATGSRSAASKVEIRGKGAYIV